MTYDDSYSPIDCSVHDVLESLATMKRKCSLVYIDEAGDRREIDAVIVDVFTSGDAEFLSTSSGLTVRLDKVASVDGLRVGAC